jgi:biopolymer transport protein ExbB
MALLGSAWVLWLLVLLSVVSIAIIIERIVFYAKIHINFPEFHSKLSGFLVEGKLDQAEEYCRNSPSVEAQVALRGFEQRNRGQKAMSETMGSFLIGERQHLDRGLVVLGTLGNNAPFIGLFGTVIGIIEAFHSLSQNAAGGPSVVMAGISEALVATAVGLIVAIPAVIAFNAFNRVIKRRMANAESIQKMLVAQLGKN